ncbi:MAG TPA: energy transducer TonB [Candidatus Polarisedimenticolaceae bacterium]
MRTRPILRLEEKIDGERGLLEALERREERKFVVVAVVGSAALLSALAAAPISFGVSPADRGVGASGNWVTLVRWMPEPLRPAPPVPPSGGVPQVAAASAPAPISLDAFREPEPIPEPPASAFLSAPVVREPEPPLGVPEPPPAPAESAISAEPEIPILPPRPAPGGKVAPTYPLAARSLRLSGSVQVEAQVDATGAVTSVRVLGTNRPGVGFEEAASRAVERWRFVPATRGSVPIPATTVVVVEFEW